MGTPDLHTDLMTAHTALLGWRAGGYAVYILIEGLTSGLLGA